MLELVLVIVILGALAAVALPRYIDMQDDARIAIARQTVGAFKTGVSLMQTKWQSAGQPKYITTSDGGKIYFNAQGWPVSTLGGGFDANGWATISGNNGHCMDLMKALVSGATVANKTDVDTGSVVATDYEWCTRAGALNGQPANAEQCNFVLTKPYYGNCYPSAPKRWINYDAAVGTITAVNF